MKTWKITVALIFVIAAIYIVPRIGKSKDKGEYDQTILDLNNRGFTNYINGQYKMAIADYTKAIQLDPDFGLAYINLG
ncbi:MAG: tetratricopeptide repeat protein, partial [Thermoplasmata archaeon]